MRWSKLSIGLALSLALTVAGCLGGMKKPEVKLEGVRLGGIGLTGGTVYVEVNVNNPNGSELRADRLTYDFDVADLINGNDSWIDFAEGEYTEEIRVGGHEARTFEIPIQFTYKNAGPAIRTVLNSGTLNYRVRGEVDVSRPIRTSVPYKKSGLVTLSGAT